jgi:uncharacterized MAPEG superfamily protein
MTLELKLLALSIVLGLVQIVLASHAASLQRGYVWTAGSRDEAVPVLTGVAGRLERALQNFVETFPLFAAAVLIAHVTATHSWMTEWGVQLYFWARVAISRCTQQGSFCYAPLHGTWLRSGSSWSFCLSSEPCFDHRTCGLLRANDSSGI